MPAHGATAAKVGQRYEDRWTAHAALKVLRGEADWIYLERIDTDETGFEFEIAVGDAIEHHQVKRQISSQLGWRIRDLRAALTAFRTKLEDPQTECFFASGNSAQGLADLSVDARNAPDFEAFEKGVLSVAERRRRFDELVDIWATDRLWVFSSLRRVHVATIGESELADLVSTESELLLEGPVATAQAALIEILRDRINQRVTALELWSDLEKVSLTPNPWRDNPALAARLRNAALDVIDRVVALDTHRIGRALAEYER